MLRNPHLASPRGRGFRSLWRVYMDLPESCLPGRLPVLRQTGASASRRADRMGMPVIALMPAQHAPRQERKMDHLAPVLIFGVGCGLRH